MQPVRLDPKGPFKRDPPAPHNLRDRLTPTESVAVLCHLGIPRIDPAHWTLTIDGLVERRLTLGLDDLLRYPETELACVHQCCGSPFEPFVPTRRVSNVTWTGALLSRILGDCRPRRGAHYIWSRGADHGDFDGAPISAYVKDLPIERVESDVLVAYELNGAPLLPEHGFPVRLVVPGFYGTNSVKWLTRIELASIPATAPFTTHWYNDPILDSIGRPTGDFSPVWSIAPESIIVSPAPGDSLSTSVEHKVWGWAWADGGVRSVRVRAGDSAPWQVADLEPPQGRQWQRFVLTWTPFRSGEITLASLAEDFNTQVQPMAGRRNAVHQVRVKVS